VGEGNPEKESGGGESRLIQRGVGLGLETRGFLHLGGFKGAPKEQKWVSKKG